MVWFMLQWCICAYVFYFHYFYTFILFVHLGGFLFIMYFADPFDNVCWFVMPVKINKFMLRYLVLFDGFALNSITLKYNYIYTTMKYGKVYFDIVISNTSIVVVRHLNCGTRNSIWSIGSRFSACNTFLQYGNSKCTTAQTIVSSGELSK